MTGKKRILFAALIAFATPAFAAEQTWTLTGVISVKGVCAAGTTCDIPSDATKGMSLVGISKVTIEVCADSGQTITGGSGIVLYLYDATSALWGQWNVTAYAVKTGARCAWVQGDMPAPFIAVPPRGRLAAVPSSMTVSSGALTVYMNALDDKGFQH